jgi:hypothetical protein
VARRYRSERRLERERNMAERRRNRILKRTLKAELRADRLAQKRDTAHTISLRRGSQPAGKLLIGIGMQSLPEITWRGVVLHVGFTWWAIVVTKQKPSSIWDRRRPS